MRLTPRLPMVVRHSGYLQEPTMANGDSTAAPVALPASPTPGKGGGFAGDVLKLVSGSTSAQILTILASPLITRLFAPEAFGTAAVFISIVGVISAVVGLRYELSIVLPEQDAEAANTAAVSLCFILLTTLLTCVVVLVGGDALLRLLRAPQLRGYLWLAPVAVLMNGVNAALGYWNTRNRNFGLMTIAQLISVVFFVTAQIAAGVAGYRSGGTLIVATVGSALVSVVFLGTTALRAHGSLFFHEVRVARMLAALKRYSNFPKYSTASAMLNNLDWQMPTFILSGFFSPAVVGYYALGNRVLRIPVGLVGANIATVFFQHASEARHNGTLTVSVEKLFQFLAKIFVFPSLLVCFMGKELFEVVFGTRWAMAGIYTQILSLYVLFWFMAVPLGIVLNVLEKQAIELRLIICAILLRPAGLLLGGYLHNPLVSLVVFSIAGVAVYGYYCFVVLRDCSVQISKVVSVFLKQALLFAPAALIITVLKVTRMPAPLTLAFAVVSTIAYYLHVLRTDDWLRDNIAGVVLRLCPATGRMSGRSLVADIFRTRDSHAG